MEQKPKLNKLNKIQIESYFQLTNNITFISFMENYYLSNRSGNFLPKCFKI